MHDDTKLSIGPKGTNFQYLWIILKRFQLRYEMLPSNRMQKLKVNNFFYIIPFLSISLFPETMSILWTDIAANTIIFSCRMGAICWVGVMCRADNTAAIHYGKENHGAEASKELTSWRQRCSALDTSFFEDQMIRKQVTFLYKKEIQNLLWQL